MPHSFISFYSVMREEKKKKEKTHKAPLFFPHCNITTPIHNAQDPSCHLVIHALTFSKYNQ